MKTKDRIMEIVNTKIHDMDTDDWQRLVLLAYYIGRESGVREISDQYNDLIAEMRKRADACRYPHMANKIIGDKNYIYSSDYRGDMTEIFGSDETNL